MLTKHYNVYYIFFSAPTEALSTRTRFWPFEKTKYLWGTWLYSVVCYALEQLFISIYSSCVSWTKVLIWLPDVREHW